MKIPDKNKLNVTIGRSDSKFFPFEPKIVGVIPNKSRSDKAYPAFDPRNNIHDNLYASPSAFAEKVKSGHSVISYIKPH